MEFAAYDDMSGLEFGDYEGLGAFINADMIKEALIASTAGGGAILAATFGVKKLSDMIALPTKVPNPLLRAGITSAATFFVGLAAGRGLYEYNREAAMGIVGGLGGLAMANLLDAAIAQMTGGTRMISALGDSDMPLSAYGDDDGMAALAALDTTGITSAPGAFHGFADPSVTPEALMGLDSAVVQQESLGDYAPYLS